MLRECLTFDDVLLVPQYSEINSRANVDLSQTVCGINFDIPLISSNMKTITETYMAMAMEDIGGLGILHRFCSVEDNVEMIKILKGSGSKQIAASVGVKDEEYYRLNCLVKNGANIICVDVAHGYHDLVRKMINAIKNDFSNVKIIAGTVCTPDAAIMLNEWGADIIRVNVGAGSLCTTRIETGNGVPQLTALMDIWPKALEKGFGVICDGGVKNAGDIVKALCFSHLVMSGSLFAGTLETPGKIIDGYKNYEGSSTYREKNVEGIKTKVKYKGLVTQIIAKLLDGIRSGCSYQGAENLDELRHDPEFIRITQASLKESGAHFNA